MDAELIGRCATQKWDGFRATLLTCWAAGDGAAEFRTPAGRTLLMERGHGVLTITALVHPSTAPELLADGWVRAGKGQGPVSKNGWDTGAVAGSPLRKSWSGEPTQLIARVLSCLGDHLSVREPRELRFDARTRAWADTLRVPAPGYGSTWHNGSSAVGDGNGSGVTRGDRGPTQCGRCGQHLGDPLSISRGYGPGCWQKIHERNVRQGRR